jgi:hypothetical protein
MAYKYKYRQLILIPPFHNTLVSRAFSPLGFVFRGFREMTHIKKMLRSCMYHIYYCILLGIWSSERPYTVPAKL